MAPKNSSPYPVQWGELKLKSKRSLGRLRDRVLAFRSTEKNRSNFDSVSQFFYPYPSEAENYHKQSFSASTTSTVLTMTEPDSTIDQSIKKDHGSERSSGEESPNKTYASSVYSEPTDDQAMDMEPIPRERRPESMMSHRLSVNLSIPTDRPYTPEKHHSNSSSIHNLKQYSRARSPDSAYSSMTHFPEIESSPLSAIDGSPSSVSTGPGPNLPPLQAKVMLEEAEQLDPILEDDPRSFSLVPPPENTDTEDGSLSLEQCAEKMFSRRHLEEIFSDPSSMLRFTSFLSTYRPASVPLLLYHLDAIKALKAIKYANAIISNSLTPISGLEFTQANVKSTLNDSLEKRARESFDALVNEDLSAYVTHVFIQVAGQTLRQRVTGSIPAHLRDSSEGLAEVFCLTDPSRHDNPIVFASEEFHRTTQYGVDYALGRNCRFLQGPATSKDSVRRIKEAIEQGHEVNELFLNYRRDGSAFMNLLTVSPLYDSKGRIRYFIGGQVDVSGLCKDATNLESLKRLFKSKTNASGSIKDSDVGDPHTTTPKYFQVDGNVEERVWGVQLDQAFKELSEMFSDAELDITRRSGNRVLQNQVGDGRANASFTNGRARLHVRDLGDEQSGSATPTESIPRKRLTSLFQHYLLVRPYPSLRILFASDALRTPGILQSPFLSRIGGSARVRDELSAALAEGRGVTAKVRWVSGRPGDLEGKARWVHCTPLLGRNGSVGVWMIVIVDEEGYQPLSRFKVAPPVAQDVRRISVGSKPWDSNDKVDSKLEVDKEPEEPVEPIEPSQLGVLPDPSVENFSAR